MKINKKQLSTLVLAIVTLTLTINCSQPKKENKSPWKEIFNGKDFSGWHQIGGEAKYTVENGEIVGRSVMNTPNSFMVSDDIYSDFILEFEVKVHDSLNSGVQIRSNSIPEYKNGRFHGYQCEIDPSDRAWSGGIYDEARRGWLYPLTYNEDGRKAFKKGQWNKYRIEAIGSHFKTWINDVPVTNLFDELTDKGYIGLQVHSIGKNENRNNTEVRWKNIRIITENCQKYSKPTTAPEVSRLVNVLTDTEKKEGWKLLFDGKTTNGWRGAHKESFPSFGWKVVDGTLTVESSGGAESEHGGDIVTQDQYKAFDLMVEFKITEGANSGIKYFVDEKEAPSGSAYGLEYQILDDYNHPDAKKFTSVEGSRTLASLYDCISAGPKRFAGVGQWNLARLIVYPDGKVEHWLNGMKQVEYVRGSEDFRAIIAKSKYADEKYNMNGRFGEAEQGHILLQDHGDEVSFRSIKIKTL